jgi:hypothetical protein
MLAVSIRAYRAGLIMFNSIVNIAKGRLPDVDVQRKVMIYFLNPCRLISIFLMRLPFTTEFNVHGISTWFAAG